MSGSDSPHGYGYPPASYSFNQPWDYQYDSVYSLAARAGQDDPAAPTQSGSLYDLLNPTVVNDPAFAYTNAAPYDMSSSRAQPGRLSNGYVDLTSSHVDLTEPDSPRRRRRRESPAPGPSSKRQRRQDGNPVEMEGSSNKSPAKIEEIDLSQDDDMLDVLKKQREEAIKAQGKPEETVTAFNTFNCVICMDRPTDITATACGMYKRLTWATFDTDNQQATFSVILA